MNRIKKLFNTNPLLVITLSLIIGGIMAVFYSRNQYQKSQAELLAELGGTQSQERQAVVETISDLIVLPKGEKPATGMIQSTIGLAKDPILFRAKKGDQIIIYTGAKFVVVYRPSTNKIVAAGLSSSVLEKAK